MPVRGTQENVLSIALMKQYIQPNPILTVVLYSQSYLGKEFRILVKKHHDRQCSKLDEHNDGIEKMLQSSILDQRYVTKICTQEC